MTDSIDLTARLQAALGDSYRLERELGGGGMSRVFLATEASLGRKVVIKLLPPEMSAAVQTERFQREIQVAASLQHPHIVPLLTAGSAGDLLYYVMPFIEGESLADRLAREGALPVADASRILRDVVDALAHAHARGVVHRDIKPGNVMLSGRHAMVTDFGVAKAVSASSEGGGSLTSLGVALGTPAYMAPEQAAADPGVDHRADIYALGAVAYEMLAGRRPFEAPTPQAMLAAHITGSPDPVGRYRASIPPALAGTVMRCLEKHPADRWQSAAELGEALEGSVTPTGGTTPVSTAPYPAAREEAERSLRRGAPVRVAVLFGLASLAVVGLAFGISRLFGLPDWVWVGAAGLMLAGLPVMLYTSRIERGRAEARTRGGLRFDAEPVHQGWFTWRRALLGGGLAFGALALLALGYAGARAWGIGPGRTLVSSGILGQADRLVLADFTNRTGDSTLGPSITEALRVDLGQSKVVRLLGTRDVAAARTRMLLDPDGELSEPAALELARREGAKAVIAGEVGPLGSGFVLTARVIETESGQERVAVRETARDPGELLPALDRLSARLRERVGESLKAIRASEPLENVTTGSLEALRVYTRAVREWEAGRQGEAVPLLERAVSLDSSFAMAWRKLGVAHFNLRLSREREVDATRRAYEHRRRLPPIERHLAEARYFERVERQPDRVMAAYRAVLDFDPDEATALNNLGLALNSRGRWGEAESLLRRAIEVHRARRSLYDNLHDAVVAQGKWATAESVTTWVAERVDQPGAFPQSLRIRAAQAAHDHLRAESLTVAVPESVISADGRIPLAFSRMDALESTGRLAKSEELLEEMARQFWDAGRRGAALDLALARPFHSGRFRGDQAAATREVAAALGRYPLDSIAPRDRPYLSLAGIYAGLGRPADVARMHAAWEASTPVAERSPAAAYFVAADAARARQELPAARRALEDAVALEGCAHCGLYQLGFVLDRLGEADSALVVLERAVTTPRWADVYDAVIWDGVAYERLGQLHEARGNRARALLYYGKFVELWQEADPGLQPRVRAAKARMATLAGEQP